MKVLIFDTETTGLLPKKLQLNSTNSFMFPYIIQLSWIIYDTKLNECIEKDYIIKCPVKIPDESINIHHITDIKSQTGHCIHRVLPIFVQDFRNCDLIVGFNMQFDLSMLEIELNRLDLYQETDIIFGKKFFDVMLESVNILKLKGKFSKYKYPKLIECYKHFFGKEFNDQHNAMGDVRATLEIYKKLME